MKQQTRQRLAALHIEIDDTVAQRHVSAVSAELKNPAPVARRRQTRRIKLGTLVAAAVLVALPTAAFAAEGAVPGDLLYPIKLATERVLLLVDPNIEAEHRIEEVEELVDRAVPVDEVTDRLRDADRSVRDRDVPDDLLIRLDVVRDRVAADYSQPDDTPVESDQPKDDLRSDEPRPTTTATTIAPETDRPPMQESTTTAPPRDDRRDATTTTAPSRDRDDPPRDG